MKLTDSGLNVPQREQEDAFFAALDRAHELGIERFVLIASNLSETSYAIELAERDSRLVVTAGIHPHQADAADDDFVAKLQDIAQHEKVRAIGECGLDYHRNYSAPERQRRVFAAQVDIAIEAKLPLYLHERDALADQLAILEPAADELVGMFTHCFTGDVTALSSYQALGCYIGVTGWVCDERRGHDLAEALPAIENTRLLLETDAPYLLPRNLRPKPKSRQNESMHLLHIANEVAKLRGQNLQEIAQFTEQNVERLFGCW